LTNPEQLFSHKVESIKAPLTTDESREIEAVLAECDIDPNGIIIATPAIIQRLYAHSKMYSIYKRRDALRALNLTSQEGGLS